jgi:hypothetical protein
MADLPYVRVRPTPDFGRPSLCVNRESLYDRDRIARNAEMKGPPTDALHFTSPSSTPRTPQTYEPAETIAPGKLKPQHTVQSELIDEPLIPFQPLWYHPA